jgi:hypothetical protein
MTTQFGFIPHNLNIDAEPKLSAFPYNVMFMSFAVKNGQRVTGTALYFPDLSTFFENEVESKMIYRNRYGNNSFLIIKHSNISGDYEGEKYVNDERVALTMGRNWKQFFIHLTILGLYKGEQCELSNVKD